MHAVLVLVLVVVELLLLLLLSRGGAVVRLLRVDVVASSPHGIAHLLLLLRDGRPTLLSLHSRGLVALQYR